MTSEPSPNEPTDPYHGGPLGAGIDWSDPNSPLAPYYTTTAGVVFAAFLGLMLLLVGLFPLNHTDFWSHLKYGEWIAANRTIPDREPLGEFTDKEAHFFDPGWLSQLAYHALFRVGADLAGGDDRSRFEGGVELVRLAHLLVAVATAGLFGLALARASGSLAWATCGTALTVVLMLGAFVLQRPQCFGLACFAALLCALSRPVPSRRSLVWLPVLLVLWANLHGSFAVGLLVLAAAVVGRAVDAAREAGWSLGAARRDTGVLRLLVVLAAAVAAVSVLNPAGPRVFVELIDFGRHPNLRTMGEWQPLEFRQARGGQWGYLITVLLLAATLCVGWRRLTTTQWLLVAVLGVWPLFQQRAMLWWVPTVVWVAVPVWANAFARWGVARPPNPPSFRKTTLAAVVLLAFVAISPAGTWVRTGRPRPTALALSPGTPNDVADALLGRVPANPGRVERLSEVIRRDHGGRFSGVVFTSETQGEYLLWALPADAPVTLFVHAQAFTPDFWAECRGVRAAAPGWSAALNRRRVGAVVVEVASSPALCAALRSHPDWRVVLDEGGRKDGGTGLFVALRKRG